MPGHCAVQLIQSGDDVLDLGRGGRLLSFHLPESIEDFDMEVLIGHLTGPPFQIGPGGRQTGR